MDMTKKGYEKAEVPEFLKVLDAIREQIGNLSENSRIIFGNVNKIKDINGTIETDMKLDTDENGVIVDLWRCVESMKSINTELHRSRTGLCDILGY